MKRERKFQFAREGKRKCNETLDEEVCRKVYIYIYICYLAWYALLGGDGQTLQVRTRAFESPSRVE